MKRSFLLLAALLGFGSGHLGAQVTSGRVTYEQVIHMNIDLPEEAAQFRDLLPKETHTSYVLNFDEKAAVYRPDGTAAAEPRSGGVAGDGMQMQFKIRVPEEITYTDLQTGRTVAQKDLMDRKFLVSDEAEKMSWKMTGRQKEILGYACQEAIAVKDSDTISAWFSPQIPESTGPMGWHGLPGLILQGAVGSGRVAMTITATKVETIRPDAAALAAPKEGKKVTGKEFKDIEEKKRKEMQEQYGGRGKVIIRTERH